MILMHVFPFTFIHVLEEKGSCPAPGAVAMWECESGFPGLSLCQRVENLDLTFFLIVRGPNKTYAGHIWRHLQGC